MSDIYCKICNEPWDVWGLAHGDVKAWEADMIRKGIGCPCCLQNEKERSPDYIKPNPLILSVCCECGFQFTIDQDEIEYDGTELYYKDKDTIMDHWSILDGRIYCDSCASEFQYCDECNGLVHTDSLYYFQDVNKSFCEDCLDKISSCTNCGTTLLDLDDNTVVIDHEVYCVSCAERKENRNENE